MYTAIKTGGHEAYKYKNFVADTVADIENISITDCCMGSTVKVIETGIEYMLNSNDEWVINLSTGSGSGDSSTQIAQLQEQITTLKEKITS